MMTVLNAIWYCTNWWHCWSLALLATLLPKYQHCSFKIDINFQWWETHSDSLGKSEALVECVTLLRHSADGNAPETNQVSTFIWHLCTLTLLMEQYITSGNYSINEYHVMKHRYCTYFWFFARLRWREGILVFRSTLCPEIIFFFQSRIWYFQAS